VGQAARLSGRAAGPELFAGGCMMRTIGSILLALVVVLVLSPAAPAADKEVTLKICFSFLQDVKNRFQKNQKQRLSLWLVSHYHFGIFLFIA